MTASRATADSEAAAPVEQQLARASGGGELTILADAVTAARRPEGFDTAGLAALADLMEAVDPATAGWNLEIAAAATLLFGEARQGPARRALGWLRYAQRAASVLAGPLSQQSCTASAHLAAWCHSASQFREAAGAFEVVVLGAEQRHQWQQANAPRIAWAWCLHQCGHCDEAVQVLRRAWDLRSTGRPRGSLAVGITCVRMLRACGLRDQAAAWWADTATISTPVERGLAADMLLGGTAAERREAAGHRTVCAHRGQTGDPARLPQQRVAPGIPALGVGGCGHG